MSMLDTIEDSVKALAAAHVTTYVGGYLNVIEMHLRCVAPSNLQIDMPSPEIQKLMDDFKIALIAAATPYAEAKALDQAHKNLVRIAYPDPLTTE